MPRYVANAFVAIAVFLVSPAACTEFEPRPTPNTQPTSTTSSTSRVVPIVTKPLDLGVLATKPCEALPEYERMNVGLPREGQETRNKVGQLECLWHDSSPPAELHFIPYPDKAVLREVYASTAPEGATFGTYETAQGLPAVMVTDERLRTCTVTIGLSEQQGFQFYDHTAGEAANCYRPVDAARWVLMNLAKS